MTAKRYFVSGYSVWDSYNNDRRVDTRSKPICDLLNQLNDENEHIKQTIKDMMENERTELGKMTLRQLWRQIQ